MPTVNLEYLNVPVPAWLSVLFVACTSFTAWLLAQAIQRAGGTGTYYWLIVVVWLTVQAGLALGGFYQTNLHALPPRLVLGALLPVVAVILAIVISPQGRRCMARLPIADLTAISVVRVGVEIGLYGLATHRLIPELMTFSGRNFDVLSGLTAPVVAILWRNQRLSRGGLIAWNVAALVLLAIIVTLALLSAPTLVQQLAFEQPNVGVLRFPFVWLPAFIVPVVLFSHIASLYQWLRHSESTSHPKK
ncbi:conserved hypothetical protein [Hymenobacter roseosalivarius DSM 11622]|uniref:Uncharacterized protein n=1 Tax=Hymenobacter roseosalivarius DSM 11622 TaxID=645990 RepID=A0A1W1W5C7_9BACT|nr:hypothetical protein [Hymenobacter roseosalivarius]SMC00591.1 conserved hypothetical protein [Hymenobacter roseosalivarius DSM 11622]